MISHCFVGVTDFSRAYDFYAGIMDVLGLQLKFCERDKEWAGWVGATPRPLFIIGRPVNGEVAAAGNGQMVALLAPSRAAVDCVHAAALHSGGKCEGPPGLRPYYHPHYYGAYFRDLDGNKIGVVCHDAPVAD